MASSVRRSALLALPALALLLAASTGPAAGPAATSLHLLGRIALVLDVLCLSAIAAVVALGPRWIPEPDERGREEEPLLHPVAVPTVVREKPLIGVVGLEDGAGATTIALNLSVAIALDGRTPEGLRPLPVCLISDGALAARLGLSPEPVRERLARHAGRGVGGFPRPELRLAGLVDVLCLPSGEIGGARFGEMVTELRSWYDVIVAETSCRDRFLAAAMAEQADFAVACVGAGSTVNSPVALPLAPHKTALAINRQVAGGAFESMVPEIPYRFELPLDHSVELADRAGRPWVLWHESLAGERLREVARMSLPHSLSQETARAS